MARVPLSELPQLVLDTLQDKVEGCVPDPKPFELDIELPAGPREDVKSRIKVLVARLSTAIIETGNDLIFIRNIIKQHGTKGTWSRFLANGLPFSESSARNYIKAAELNNSATVAEIAMLAPTAMYAVARAPDDIRYDVETLLTDKVVVTAAEVKDMAIRAAPATDGHQWDTEESLPTLSPNVESLAPRSRSQADDTGRIF